MEAKDIPLDCLLLDPNNYRLQEVSGYVSVASERFQLEQVQKTTLLRLQDEGLRELQKSIVANGFLPIERIVVSPYPEADGKYLVIEGNRRVAALRGLWPATRLPKRWPPPWLRGGRRYGSCAGQTPRRHSRLAGVWGCGLWRGACCGGVGRRPFFGSVRYLWASSVSQLCRPPPPVIQYFIDHSTA